MRKVLYKCRDYFKDKDSAKIDNVKIAMINSDFKLSNALNLTNLCEILSENSVETNGNLLSIVYQPIKYPAINSKFICNKYLESYNNHVYKYAMKKKFDKTISILIFRSGSIIITGGNDINDYFEVYNYILNLIKSNLKNLLIIN